MRSDLLSIADKDLICDFIYRSVGRVLNKNIVTWEEPIPQGVSVFLLHPERGEVEYMFTKDDKYPVVRDDLDIAKQIVRNYGNMEAGGIVLYLNSCMLAVASKHSSYSY